MRTPKLCALICFGLAHCEVVTGAGVAAVKDQPFHSDAAANPIAYTSLFVSNGPLAKITVGSKEQTIERSKLVAWVEVPPVPPFIDSESAIQPIRRASAEMTAFVKRFPRSSPILQGHITSYNEHVAKFNAGEIRYNGVWLTKEDYAPIVANKKKIEEDRRKKREEVAKREAAIKEKEEAFAAAQRAKGLELHNGQWLPATEVAAIRKRQAALAGAEIAVGDKTVSNGVYSVFQVANGGLLIRIHRGQIRNGGTNTDVAYLFGAVNGMAADGDVYEGTLYWCGTHTYQSVDGNIRTVNAYSRDKNDAIQRVATTLSGENSVASTDEGGARPTGADRNDKSPNTPEALEGASASGSGFFVGNEGYFVTNAHVVKESTNVAIHFEGKSHQAEIIKISKIADLALLKISKAVQGVPISETDAEPGQDVYAIGFPQPELQGMAVKVTKGVISSSKGFRDDDSTFQIDAAVQPGNSGGPLCDQNGRLVGVVVSGLDPIVSVAVTGTLPQNVNYAIKASEVGALLRSKSVSAEVKGGGIGKSGPVSGVKTVCAATGMVIVR